MILAHKLIVCGDSISGQEWKDIGDFPFCKQVWVGSPGTTSDNWTPGGSHWSRLINEIPMHKSYAVVWCCGSNDSNWQVPKSRYCNNHLAAGDMLLNDSPAPNATSFVTISPPWAEGDSNLRLEYRDSLVAGEKHAETNRVTHVDLQRVLGPDGRTGDGTHLDEHGNDVLATLVEDAFHAQIGRSLCPFSA